MKQFTEKKGIILLICLYSTWGSIPQVLLPKVVFSGPEFAIYVPPSLKDQSEQSSIGVTVFFQQCSSFFAPPDLLTLSKIERRGCFKLVLNSVQVKT